MLLTISFRQVDGDDCMEDKKKTSIHPAEEMKDGEEKRTPGFCGKCNRENMTWWWLVRVSADFAPEPY